MHYETRICGVLLISIIHANMSAEYLQNMRQYVTRSQVRGGKRRKQVAMRGTLVANSSPVVVYASRRLSGTPNRIVSTEEGANMER
jgi:hypothetical protein